MNDLKTLGAESIEIVLCRELTKKFERVHRGFLSELAEQFADVKIKGEVTVVIAGNNPKFLRVENNQE